MTAVGSTTLATDDPTLRAVTRLRERLGTVAPRDPKTRRLGPRVHRLDLLHELCEAQTFEHVVGWLSSERLSDGTRREYADDVRHWARAGRELVGTEPWYLGAITSDVIPAWRAWTDDLGLGPRRVNRLASSLTSLIEYTKFRTRAEILNPITKHDRPVIDPHDESAMTPILEVPEFQAVVAQAQTPRQALVPVLIYTLAGRVSECCAAGKHHMDSTGGECKLDLTRKGGKGRKFTLPPLLCELGARCWGDRESGPLLLDDDDRPMDRHAVDRLLNRLGRAAGVLPGRDLTPHVLRASKLTHMYDQGVKPDDIRRFADHSHIATTMRYIRRRDDEALKREHAAAAVHVYEGLVDRFL
ncbi:tyrosine-type recombinase/integrase [Streptomyces africanus]|uniref:tyrosine-type recombinase/integrase n=1 Tax=Streptomyces africanus TaxID=231024 RepID=UPI001FC9EB45|nr:tyrosine-type recombinase/integrase [Streptomyces africanus]